ncbi:helix-turn-helix domain-containing protein [Marinobacterium rhizophilum]|uniref:Helix-turn-helix transcriptional regulator n=1 Tax=Marinobacterium rhizophilum TaxID=420402 RepID=A0ABY5HGC1_9GAMM|nr:XRE family transcriptional regulator [Marinobacterium rhizophilum]UTW11416.1 helix-turn-helix transcriptional regulator [Marinobacterium rhizophilum]
MDTDSDTMRLAGRIKALRQSRGLTLVEVEKRCGLGASTVSKIERGTISPSYATLLRLAKGLDVDLAELVQQTTDIGPKTRRAITRMGEGVLHSIGSHDYRLLCTELTSKKMNPMLATVHARELKEIVATGDRKNGMSSHEGEEVLFVVSGEVVLHTEFYSPVLLKQGDCAYIDSSMGHVCLKGSEEDAVIFWVCTDLSLKPELE